MTAIDEQMSPAPQVPAENGKSRQRFLRDDPELKRQRPEQNRSVVDALMVRDENVGRARRDPFKPFDGHAHAGGSEDEKRPRTGARVREVTTVIPQARNDRGRAEDDGV